MRLSTIQKKEFSICVMITNDSAFLSYNTLDMGWCGTTTLKSTVYAAGTSNASYLFSPPSATTAPHHLCRRRRNSKKAFVNINLIFQVKQLAFVPTTTTTRTSYMAFCYSVCYSLIHTCYIAIVYPFDAILLLPKKKIGFFFRSTKCLRKPISNLADANISREKQSSLL